MGIMVWGYSYNFEFLWLRNHESLWKAFLEGERAELYSNPALTQLSHYINPADTREEKEILPFWGAAEGISVSASLLLTLKKREGACSCTRNYSSEQPTFSFTCDWE